MDQEELSPEEMSHSGTKQLKPEQGGSDLKGVSPLLRFFMVLLVLAAGAFFANTLLKSGPTATRKPPERRARLVEVQSVHFSNYHVTIEGMGTVQPERQIDLYARVDGEVRWLSPLMIPGGHFFKGEKILQIDPSDYELVIREHLADLKQAQSNLKLELGQQNIALREFELLGAKAGKNFQKKDHALALRLPQLENVRAGIEKSQVGLEKAKLDLGRTKITSPFNAIIMTQDVNLGAVITSGSKLATLVGTDQYRVEVLIPVNQLRWIKIPGMNEVAGGSSAKIYDRAAWGPRPFRKGKVIRLAGDLEAEGRMARLLISIPDPLGREAETKSSPHLLIGAFVRVAIAGRTLNQVMAIDRELLRDGDTVWLMNKKNELEIRPLEIVYRNREQVFVSHGLQIGERLVMTDLAAPLAGMPLRTQTTASTSSSKSE